MKGFRIDADSGDIVDLDARHPEAMPGETRPGYRPELRGSRVEFEMERPPAEPPSWPFDEPKLRRLLADAEAAAAARRDASERRRDARERLTAVRGEKARAAQLGQEVGRDLASRLRAAEEAFAAADDFYAETQERGGAVMELARRCAAWAEREHGWRADGSTGVIAYDSPSRPTTTDAPLPTDVGRF